MSETAEAQDIEVNVADNTATQEGIRKMMDQWADGDLTSANDTFNNLIGRKADDMVALRKAEILPTLFGDAEEEAAETEEENEGVSDEDI
tara:strand:- start:127 stop:396 length:270 start_codon:yes stop_codon:yes gene_type:complete